MNNQINKQIDIRRANLIEKSQQARKYKEEQLNNAKTEAQLLYWQSVRINDIIASWYKEETGASEFKTFAQWKKECYNIIQGSISYVLW